VFNLGRYLPEAVESVMAQTYQDFELIIIDDGSTDEYTNLLLDHWPYARARVLRQANRGVAVARNQAISQGCGRYICCLDADDRLRPAYFERAIECLDADTHTGFVSGQMQMFDGERTLIIPVECALPAMLAENLAFEPAMFRRSAWEAVGGYCSTFIVSGIEDWDLWISFLEFGYRCEVLPDVIFDYRVLPNSMTSRMELPDRWAALIGELVTRHPALYREHLVSVLMQNARRIAELRAWANSLEKTHAWLEQQALSWQQNSERLERLLAAQIEWSQQLQIGKEWLEQQLREAGLAPE
jgi:glycosyltransferase involved in cell wall biosynthesis